MISFGANIIHKKILHASFQKSKLIIDLAHFFFQTDEYKFWQFYFIGDVYKLTKDVEIIIT